MLRTRALAQLLILLAAARMGLAAGPVSSSQIDQIFSQMVSPKGPGAAVLVVRSGKAVFERGYGIANLRSMRKIDAQTNFRLASVTKQFTAMAIMLLVRDGKLHYDDRLTDVFPGFPAYGKAITIRELLNHTSGLQDYEDLMSPPAPGPPPGKISQIQDAAVLDLLEHQTTTKFTPGTKWEHSNSGYVALGLVVAKVSGQSFGQFLHDRIFAPLGMTSTIAYQEGKNEVSNRAYGYRHDKDGWHENDQSPTSATLGDGGVYTSLHDMVRWDKAVREHILLNTEEMQAALTPVRPPDGMPYEPDGTTAEYGFGWFLNSYKGHRRMWHYGETVGFRTAIERFPEDKLTIVILCNREDLSPQSMALKVADLYLAPNR